MKITTSNPTNSAQFNNNIINNNSTSRFIGMVGVGVGSIDSVRCFVADLEGRAWMDSEGIQVQVEETGMVAH
jgi:hypothetical protein